MSILRPDTVPCPACGHVLETRIAETLNAGRSPLLRDAVREGRFQRYVCASCSSSFEVDDPFSYIDFVRQLWIGVFPRAWEARWSTLEDEPRRVWQTYLIDHAPPWVAKMAEPLRVRTVFGLDALREKVLCLEAGIDDRWIEALKLDVMRREPRIGLDERRRVTGISDETIELSSTASGAGAVVLERRALTAAAMEPWASLIEQMDAGPYVDLGRILLAA